MNKLNPIYIVALFITILFISFFLLSAEKEKYSEKLNEHTQIELKTKEYKEFKTNWNNEKFVNKTLDQILRSRVFKNQKVLRAKANNAIKIKMHSDDPKILNSFLNKVLNKKLVIKKLELEKNFINLEIGLK